MKYWLTSKTVIGALVALVASLAGVAQFLGANLGEIVDALTALAGAIGALLALYGRFKATEPVSFK